MEHKGLCRVVAAAVVSQSFRCRLLENPLEAVRSGYFGQSFLLTEEECDLLASIQASDLPSFSERIYQWVSRNGNGNGHNGRMGRFTGDGEPRYHLPSKGHHFSAS